MRYSFTVGDFAFEMSDRSGRVGSVSGAVLVEDFDAGAADLLVVNVTRLVRGAWLFVLRVDLSFESAGGVFLPGLLFVPESATLFMAAGENILVYDVNEARRIASDSADCGFWAWHRFGDVIVMQAELDVSVWTLDGSKRWETFADPPHTVRREGETLILDDSRKEWRLDLSDGGEREPL